jgi:hypothetical protein
MSLRDDPTSKRRGRAFILVGWWSAGDNVDPDAACFGVLVLAHRSLDMKRTDGHVALSVEAREAATS